MGVCHFRDCLLATDGANFSNADLRDAAIVRCDLEKVAFVDADCTGASFSWNEFIGCDFRGANLEGAELGGSVFRNTDFRGANFANVDLRKVEFHHCNFADAIFSAVRLRYFQLLRLAISSAQRKSAILSWFGGKLPPEVPLSDLK